jgi:hypothetical protein
MRRLSTWLLLVLSLAACAGQPARGAAPSDVSERAAMLSPEALPEGEEMFLDVIDAGHWRGAPSAAAADALVPDIGFAIVDLSHTHSKSPGSRSSSQHARSYRELVRPTSFQTPAAHRELRAQ